MISHHFNAWVSISNCLRRSSQSRSDSPRLDRASDHRNHIRSNCSMEPSFWQAKQEMINLVESAASICQGGFLLIPEVVDIEAPQVAIAGNGFLDEEIKGQACPWRTDPVFCMGTSVAWQKPDVEIVQRFRILCRHLFFIFKIAVDGAD